MKKGNRDDGIPFSQNGARNWDLVFHDEFVGTKRELKSIVKDLLSALINEDSSDSCEYDINFDAVANLSKILAECPWKDGYIMIRNW